MPFPFPRPNYFRRTSALLCTVALGISPSGYAKTGHTPDGWAYSQPQKVSPPEVADPAWNTNPIDAFIFSGLQKNDLSPNPEADRLVLLRRACYDLVGLPPTQEQIDAFLQDDAPHAWERLIDQLLDSPHYGEKWGRHWLDVVRWAESSGYERDADKRNMWKYRDYVINATNEDKPYNEFIIDQLAGDVRPDASAESIIATGFLRLGLYDDEPADEELFYYDYYDDLINTVSRSMLATSMSCARCHDHKIDPLLQKEYYQFLAYFRNLYIPFRVRNEDTSTVSVFDADTKSELTQQLDKAIVDIAMPRLKMWQAANQILNAHTAPAESASLYPFDLKMGFVMDEWDQSYPDLDGFKFQYEGELARGPIALVSDLTQITQAKTTASAYVFTGKFNQPEAGSATFLVRINGSGWMYLGGEPVFSKVGLNEISEDFSIKLPAGIHELQLVVSRKSDLILELNHLIKDESIPWVSSTVWRKVKGSISNLLKDKSTQPDQWSDLFDRNQKLENQAVTAFKPIEEKLSSSLVTAAYNSPEEKQTHILFRGNPHALGEEVQPGLPGMLGPTQPETVPGEDRRLTLAKWIGSESNPLTSRVAANRIWQHHFGRGLVRSSDEFGGLGEKPTHPELLDWLANEFVRDGWKMKPLHRLIMTSKTYRMSSLPNEKALVKDPQNDHFWRFNMRRLTAEEIRDSILQVTGNFNPVIGGPSVFPALPEEVLSTASRPEDRWNLEAGPEHQNRRSLYTFTRRSLLDPMMATFDAADTDTSCPVRFNTTGPGQALALMNSSFIAEHAELLKNRLKQIAPQDTEALVRTGFEVVLGRQPDESELQVSIDLIQSMQQDFGHDVDTAYERFALMMLNLNEFLYLD